MVDTPGRLSLWGIEVFVAVAEERSVSAAARRVGTSPSAVSQQLTNLEAALGATLVDRAARPLALTPAGQSFRRRGQTILNEATLARAELAMQDLAHLTRFQLGMIEDFDADVTPRFLTEMSSDLTACQFLLETGPSHRLFDQLEARALDVIVAADIGASAAWMEVAPLLGEPFVAAVPQGLAVEKDPSFGDLTALPYIQYTQRHHMGRQIAAHLARYNLQVAHRFELDSYHAILSLVAQGAGWTILTPLGFLRAQRFVEDVAIVPLPAPPLDRTISLTARHGVLGDMPAGMAARLRPILDEMIVRPTVKRFDWLAPRLAVIGT
ncbi:MAG: LysR family transcriptional regulator [Pseudomonadota bacterium]